MKPFSLDKNILPLLIFIALLMASMIGLGPKETLDKKFYYTGEQARTLLHNLDAAHQQIYFVNELFDLILICSYTMLFFIFAKKLFPHAKIMHFFAFIPGFCDLIETSTILYALKNPDAQNFFDWLGIFTFCKWTLGAIFVLAITSKMDFRSKSI